MERRTKVLLIGLVLVLACVQAAQAATFTVAASNAPSTVKSQANVVCDGVHDEVEIQNAINSVSPGSVVQLTQGTFNIGTFNSGNKIILPYGKAVTLKGMGKDTTILNIASANEASPSYKSGIAMLGFKPGSTGYQTLADLQITHSGFIAITGSNIQCINVKALDLLGDYDLAVFRISLQRSTDDSKDVDLLENVYFKGCDVIDSGRTGFQHYSANEGSSLATPLKATIRNVTYEDCQAINCARYDRPDSPSRWYQTGFDLAEKQTLLKDAVYRNCYASGTFLNGFHAEFMSSYQNVRLYNCTSADSAQKEKMYDKLGVSSIGASGFNWAGANFFLCGDIYCENCKSLSTSSDPLGSTRWGFYIRSTDDGKGRPVLKDCSDDGSYIGLHFRNVFSNDGALVDGFTSRNNIDNPRYHAGDYPTEGNYPVYFSSPQNNVVIKNLKVEWTKGGQNPGKAVYISVSSPNEISVSGSSIANYRYGIYNTATGSKPTVSNVQTSGVTTPFTNCNVVSSPVVTPTPTPSLTPRPTPTPTPVGPAAPYTALAIPGRINAADFDLGGEGVAYHDDTATNTQGYNYRTDNAGVDVGWRDSIQKPVVGQAHQGEWLKYSKVAVATSATYNAKFYTSTAESGKSFSVLADGKKVATVAAPNTGDWNTFLPTSVQIPLTAGGHTIQIQMDTGSVDLAYVDLT